MSLVLCCYLLFSLVCVCVCVCMYIRVRVSRVLLGVCVSCGRSVLRSVVVMSVTVTRYAGLCLLPRGCACAERGKAIGSVRLLVGRSVGRSVCRQKNIEMSTKRTI